jgi:hypothetical protein
MASQPARAAARNGKGASSRDQTGGGAQPIVSAQR